MSQISEMQGRTNGQMRSEQSTLFEGAPGKDGLGIIELLNPEGAQMTEEQQVAGREFLRNGYGRIVVPARNEYQYGEIDSPFASVLRYAKSLTNPSSILVIDADSIDGTGKYAESQGIHTIRQGDIEQYFRMDKILQDFGIDRLPRGKGRTVLAFLAYDKIYRTMFAGGADFNIFSDADISNPDVFKHPEWLAWVLSQAKPGQAYAEVCAAQHGRNNQEVMGTLTALQNNSPVTKFYHSLVRGRIWPLTGQYARRRDIMTALPNALGYGTEILYDLAICDLATGSGFSRAQVEIPDRCRDGENTPTKEAAMMAGISAMLMTIDLYAFQEGHFLTSMPPYVYQNINRHLARIEEDFMVPAIQEMPGPNNMIPARLDRILPPVDYLVEQGYIDTDGLARYVRSIYPN
ncbi:hypothetical protein CO051_07415 [Candidatus Roizmanbacteria bacterium CG_4_9_14_0_2_um_filter_39_13]|uniref:Uncharacterized protein n=1 Tax=Candidatus Roizmanbacteria bacterium CG_4_9_14_0_2_um_filter_39_13 TaxID=1974839 RepID=A0A2M8EW52_9BACT|nr:MAG: hypothetical protein COY15_02560 [Candidatus Roizmanbacteria bacterium CG_4_10_14_0_2_um_filter_39_12]PJC30098.1 MAG: hypothetical protein CO051_07415 [Candidatus Roizmanbacteria bacterium CG_4_9_14_0_2_um_filter_39_13]